MNHSGRGRRNDVRMLDVILKFVSSYSLKFSVSSCEIKWNIAVCQLLCVRVMNGIVESANSTSQRSSIQRDWCAASFVSEYWCQMLLIVSTSLPARPALYYRQWRSYRGCRGGLGHSPEFWRSHKLVIHFPNANKMQGRRVRWEYTPTWSETDTL